MPDDQVDQPDEAAEKPQQTHEELITNLKAEFSRKQSNLEAQQADTNAQLQAIMAEVQKSMKAPEGPKRTARELVFDDPDEFVRQVKADAVSEASEVVNRQYQTSQAVQNAVSAMQQQFPEFSQEGSEAVILATKKAAALPAYLKGKPEGVRIAMQETAIELGLVAASRRKTTVGDEPVVGSRGSGSTPPRKTGKIDDKTAAFAELLGMDMTDKKFMAELEKASSRKNFGEYK